MSFVCEKPSECPVCYEPLNEDKALSCGHWVHKSCIIKSKKDNCPMCRQKVKLTRREREDMINLMAEEAIPQPLQQPPIQEEELPYTMPNEIAIVTLYLRRRIRAEDEAIMFDGRVIADNGNRVKIAFTNEFEAMNFCSYIERKVSRVLIEDLRRNTSIIQSSIIA